MNRIKASFTLYQKAFRSEQKGSWSTQPTDQLGPLTNSAHTILAQLLTTVWHIRKANILQKIAPNQYSHLQLHWAYRWVKFENIQFDLI